MNIDYYCYTMASVWGSGHELSAYGHNVFTTCSGSTTILWDYSSFKQPEDHTLCPLMQTPAILQRKFTQISIMLLFINSVHTEGIVLVGTSCSFFLIRVLLRHLLFFIFGSWNTESYLKGGLQEGDKAPVIVFSWSPRTVM